MKKSNTEVAQILNSSFKNANFEIPSKEKFTLWGGKNCAWLESRVTIEHHVSKNFFKKFHAEKLDLFDKNNNSIYPILKLNGYNIHVKVDNMSLFGYDTEKMVLVFYAVEV